MNFIFNDNVRILCLSCYVKKVGKLVRFRQKGQKQHHSSPFINVVKGVFFVVRVTLVPVSYLSAPSAVHSYRVPGKFIRRLKSLFVCWKVYSYSTNKAKNYSYNIFVQQMYWLQDKILLCLQLVSTLFYSYQAYKCIITETKPSMNENKEIKDIQ
jgi:hypothetical protein